MIRGMQSSRRSVLKAGLSGAALSLLGAGWSKPQASGSGSLKLILMTDTHVGDAAQAVRAAKAMQLAQKRSPDLIIFGGDNVMNVDSNKTFEQTKAQFDIWADLVKSNIKAPHHSVIGNHDIWWASADHPQAALREKAYALQVFGMPKRYYRVETRGWRILMLDVFHSDGCYVDKEQMEWLESEIASAKGPVLLVSHAPIISATHFMELGPPKNGNWAVPTSWQVGNCVDLMKMFWKYPQVKLALSGHMHHIDRVDYHRVTYVCGGAVSGSWWGGDYHGFGPAWVEIELDRDGLKSYNPVFWEK